MIHYFYGKSGDIKIFFVEEVTDLLWLVSSRINSQMINLIILKTHLLGFLERQNLLGLFRNTLKNDINLFLACLPSESEKKLMLF